MSKYSVLLGCIFLLKVFSVAVLVLYLQYAVCQSYITNHKSQCNTIYVTTTAPQGYYLIHVYVNDLTDIM